MYFVLNSPLSLWHHIILRVKFLFTLASEIFVLYVVNFYGPVCRVKVFSLPHWAFIVASFIIYLLRTKSLPSQGETQKVHPCNMQKKWEENVDQDILAALLIRRVGYINRTIEPGEKQQFFINKSVVVVGQIEVEMGKQKLLY